MQERRRDRGMRVRTPPRPPPSSKLSDKPFLFSFFFFPKYANKKTHPLSPPLFYITAYFNMSHGTPFKKSTAKMRWKWKKKRTRRLQRKRRKMRARAK
jgi:large subunit ribosomal protein L41e